MIDATAPTTTADLLALLDSDPAGGILAVADLRERRAKAATQGGWFSGGTMVYTEERSSRLIAVTGTPARELDMADAVHVAAEANPAHSFAAVRRWRGVVERHQLGVYDSEILGRVVACACCTTLADEYPCPDLTETTDEARAYLGGAA